MKKEKRTVGFTENVNYVCFEDLQQAQNISIVNPINLDYCGREKCEPGFQFGPFIRECYVIHMVFGGCGELQLGGAHYRLSKGQAFLIRPREEVIYRADQADPWEYQWVGFHGCRAEEFVRQIGFEEGNPVIEFHNEDGLERIVQQMLDARQLTFTNEMIRMSALFAFFALLTQENVDVPHVRQPLYTDSVYVRDAVNLIMSSYKKKIRVAELADMIGISRGHLTNVFKKELKVSPQEFLMNYRMEKAAQLLRETEMPVNVVAAEVGYSDSLSFSKLFKQRYGMSPSRYRETEVELEKKEKKGEYTSENPL